MKVLLFTTLFCLLELTNSNSQNSFNLSLEKSSEFTTNSYEHFYLLKLENLSSNSQSFVYGVEDASCKYGSHRTHSKFNLNFYDMSKTKTVSEITLGGNKSTTFYVKVSIPRSTPLSTWNCSTVKVYNATTNEKRKINLVSFLQDPAKVE